MALEHSSPKGRNPILYKMMTEPVLATACGGVYGAVTGGLGGMVIMGLFRRNPRAITSMSPSKFVRMCAGGFSVINAVDLGIGSVMRGIRGKDDVNNRLVSGSGSGLVISFLTRGLKGQPAHALFCAAGLAVMSGTAYQLVRSFNAQDAVYKEARAMLVKLGLEEYEKNFKKGHFTDTTLPLLTDSDLKDVGIPSGARRLILDHIKRYNKKVNRK